MTVVATKTLIAGREVEIAVTDFTFSLLVAMIVRWGRSGRTSDGRLMLSLIGSKWGFFRNRQGCSAAWRNVAQRVVALVPPPGTFQ
jgi:hypothetical protein